YQSASRQLEVRSAILAGAGFLTFPARTMALRSPPGLSKRRTHQLLSLNPAAILSAVGSDFRSRQKLTNARRSFRRQRSAASKNAAAATRVALTRLCGISDSFGAAVNTHLREDAFHMRLGKIGRAHV